MMDSMDVYEFALGLFGLQIDLIGFLQRIDYCGPSIGCMQPLVHQMLFTFRVRTSSEIQKSRVFQGCFTVFSRAFLGFLEVQNENNVHNEL